KSPPAIGKPESKCRPFDGSKAPLMTEHEGVQFNRVIPGEEDCRKRAVLPAAEEDSRFHPFLVILKSFFAGCNCCRRDFSCVSVIFCLRRPLWASITSCCSTALAKSGLVSLMVLS